MNSARSTCSVAASMSSDVPVSAAAISLPAAFCHSGRRCIPSDRVSKIIARRVGQGPQLASIADADRARQGGRLSFAGSPAPAGSEPDHIAKQMLVHLGGLWGVSLLADLDTLKLLNKMAGGLRRKRNEDDMIEESFELRSASVKDWTDLIAQRQSKQPLLAGALAEFTKRNVIRPGLETDCPNCNAKNWSTLTAVDYRITCERCLKPYDFPQAALREQNRDWTYRAVGPFSERDYGRGSYGALLALRVLCKIPQAPA